jgi:hypothetical protein
MGVTHGSEPLAQLALYEDYSRRDVHGLFDPTSNFVPQAGLWGILGLIEIPRRPGDFVFLVTFGRSQGEHSFDEGISTEGVLRWQSQPHQELDDPRIERLIGHDADRNSVHLFLRTAARRGGVIAPYTYLGRLAYDGHDRERSRPVHFRWTLLDWPIPDAVRARINLRLEDEFAHGSNGADADPNPRADDDDPLIEELPPLPTADIAAGEPTRAFQAARRRRPTEEETRALGHAGELLVFEREKRRLVAAGRVDLAGAVLHTAKVEGDGAGFDIRSFFLDGRHKFIEVKTTTGPKDTDFIISANEIAFSVAHPEDFELCRVFGYERRTNRARFYSISGDITKFLWLTATQYRAKVLRARGSSRT